MVSIEDKIAETIQRKRKGSIILSADFVHLAPLKTILKALERLTNQGKVVRLARGIYCKPKMDTVFGLGVVYPGLDEIAQAIAKRDHIQIVPSGEYAQNRLGLSTQVPMNYVYLTDGSPRRIKIYNGKGILFKRISPKNFKFKSPLAMMITFALKDLGEGNLSEEQFNRIKQLLSNEDKSKVIQDYPLMPEWIRRIFQRIYA